MINVKHIWSFSRQKGYLRFDLQEIDTYFTIPLHLLK
jgi:hypothetical protein